MTRARAQVKRQAAPNPSPARPARGEFLEAFRPLSILPAAKKESVRDSFHHLVGTMLENCVHPEERAAAAISIRDVATALGFDEEAALAAKIVNFHNASVTADNDLSEMVGLK